MPPQPDAVVLAFQRRQARVLAKVSAAVRRSWDSLPNYRSDSLAAFLADVEAVLPAAQSVMASSVDAMTAILSESAPIGIPAEVFTEVRGITLAEEYRRPFLELWKGLNDGTDLSDLVKAGGDRVQAMAAMDTQKAMVNSMDHLADVHPRVRGYRRTLTGKSCMFCAAASTRVYHGRHLAPLHDHCDCGVAPIIGNEDPGQVVNHELLESLKARGPEYWKQSGFVDANGAPFPPTEIPSGLTQVVEHGELGPILQAA